MDLTILKNKHCFDDDNNGENHSNYEKTKEINNGEEYLDGTGPIDSGK